MTTDRRRKIVRCCRWVVLAHTAFVLVAVVSKNAMWGSGAPWWSIDRVLRFIDLPVLWAVDRTVQSMPLIPPWAAFGRLWVATSVSEFVAYGLFGGAFYALLVAAIVFLRERKHGTTSAAQVS
jgi:hypothetical protein